MSLPDIKGPDRAKPLCYDPRRHKFITFDELVSGAEKVVPLSSLSQDDLKKLILERNRVGPEYAMQSISGPKMERDDVMREIENETSFGKMALQAEAGYLARLLTEIQEALRVGEK